MSDHNDVPATSFDYISGRDEVVQKAISAAKQADELRGAAITRLLELRAQIERDLETLAYRPLPAFLKNGHAKHAPVAEADPKRTVDPRAFRDLTVAEASKIVLQEYGTLHGKELERLLKQGGLRSKIARFQGYLGVALKRDGGFENTGGNTWRLASPE
jgi:hypothetical protein